jgi:DNA-binding transcriptional MerR regulator
MEYTVDRLAKLSGISTRTLRYYDTIGLLRPLRVEENGYRVYGEAQVDELQQILFYRELGMSLKEIQKVITLPNFDREAALRTHLLMLAQEKERIETLIENVRATLRTMRGEQNMTAEEKFEGFKQEMIVENEKHYGREAREKYGDSTVDASNKKLFNMTEDMYRKMETLSIEVGKTLAEAMETGDPAGELAQRACALHAEWISVMWPKGTYSKAAHLGLGEMYVADERFQAYYDKIHAGAAQFLLEALKIYCK